MDTAPSSSTYKDNVIIIKLQSDQSGIPAKTNEEADRVLTQKFLNGEISFTEYESHIKEETEYPDEDIDDEDFFSSSISEEASSATFSAVPPKKSKRGPKIRKPILPPALKGLMGEANLRYARGDVETAEKMCLEVIRQVPTAPEPFLTLAQIYESDNFEKSAQFSLIAAYLQPHDQEQWVRLAQHAESQNDFKQAIACYTKAIAADSSKVENHLIRIELIKKLGDKKFALRSYLKLLSILNPDTHAEMILSLSKLVAEQFHAENDVPRAIQAMDHVFKKCPSLVTPEHINIMLELLIAHNDLSYCIDILIQHCNISVELELPDTLNPPKESSDNNSLAASGGACKILYYVVPPDILIDIRIKFTIIMIRMKAFQLLDQLLEPILQYDNVDHIGDLYLDVAEELMAANKHADALKLIIPLLKNKSFSMAAVWLKHADCLKACGLEEEAVDSYKQVILLAPQHVAVRHALAELLFSLNRKDEALEALEQDESLELDVGLMLKRARALYEQQKYEEFFNCCLLLLSRHGPVPRNRDELALVYKLKPSVKSGRVRAMREFRGENPVDDVPSFSNTETKTTVEEYELFRTVMQTCKDLKRYALMEKFAIMTLNSPKFKQYAYETEVIALWACFYNEDFYIAYNIIREMLMRQVTNPRLWNLYNLIIQRTDDFRHNRFVMRLLSSRIQRQRQKLIPLAPIDPLVHLVHANNCLAAGTYKYALNEYMETYREVKHPLVALLISLTMLQMGCQKFTDNKEPLLIQAIAFLEKYKELRGPDGIQEVNYNMGRAFHMMGAPHLAVHYYKSVLNSNNPFGEEYAELLDLKREAAYNLHLLYMQSGSEDTAKAILLKYLTI